MTDELDRIDVKLLPTPKLVLSDVAVGGSSKDDAAFTAALNSAGAGYMAASQAHVGQRTAYAGAQNLASLSYVIQELMSAANVNNII